MRNSLLQAAALAAGLAFATSAHAVDLPADATPEEAAAYAALEASCAGCHQDGKLAMPEAMAGFGTVLDLRGMAAEGKYVVPGNPDGSVLAIFASGTGHPIASLDEDGLTALRAWIASLE